jgi:hypothetical protein
MPTPGGNLLLMFLVLPLDIQGDVRIGLKVDKNICKLLINKVIELILDNKLNYLVYLFY